MAETNTYKPVTHCIFDMDGLLLNTEGVYEDVTRQIAQAYDKPYPVEVRLKVLGTSDEQTALTIITDLGLPMSVEEFLEEFNKICIPQLAHCPVKEGADRLLRHLHEHKIPFCLATSTDEKIVEIIISNHLDIFKLFSHRVCGSSDPEVKEGKPAPDIFLIAAARFVDKPEPSQCLVFEDSPNGVKAALSAGMQVVMVPDERLPLDVSELATQRLRSLIDFEPQLFCLPPFEN